MLLNRHINYYVILFLSNDRGNICWRKQGDQTCWTVNVERGECHVKRQRGTWAPNEHYLLRGALVNSCRMVEILLIGR